MARKQVSNEKGSRPTKPKLAKSANRPARKRGKTPSQELLNYKQMFALSSQVRVEIFAILCERIASPKEISEEVDGGLTNLSYHVKVLRECKLIVETERVPRRGAVEHFYEAVKPTLIPPDAWDHLPSAMRKSISANILQHFFDDADASMEAGVFDEAPGELSWTPLILDTLGIEKLGQLSRNFLASVLELQCETNKRLPKENGKAIDVASATVFLASFLSARSPREKMKASTTQRR